MKPLFEPDYETDDVELKAALKSPEVREFLENQWQQYYSRNMGDEMAFRGDLQAQPHSRIWEMILANAFVDYGFDLVDRKSEGPDIRLRNPTICIEAVTSTDGALPNKTGIQPVAMVPEFLLTESMFGGPPEEEMILRWLTVIDEKLKKLNGYDHKTKRRSGYIEKAIVSETDPFVVALNTHQTSFSVFDHQHTQGRPPMTAFVYGYGKAQGRTLIPRGNFSRSIPLGIVYEYRSQVTKRSGSNVRADIFFHCEYSGISALIVSKVGVWSWQNRIPTSLSEEFTILHNPLATNPLPKGWLKNGHELWIEDGELQKRFWTGGKEHSSEKFPLPFDLPDEIREKLDGKG